VNVLRWDDYPLTRWKNGAGTTREVARHPAGPPAGPDDFDWRVSIAEVPASSAFSSFPGVARVIVQVAGEPMTLSVGGQEHLLELYRPFTFDGGAATTCRLSGGATTDLNVMTRQAVWTAEVSVHDDERVRIDMRHDVVTLVVPLSGRRTVAAGSDVADVGPLDMIRLAADLAAQATGRGRLALVRLARS
jgi:uncharacterized protein